MDNEKNPKNSFAGMWKKVSNLGQKTVDGVKNVAEQTKQGIHDQQAKKYEAVTGEAYRSADFQMPTIVKIEDDAANRNFVGEDAIGWIEKHKNAKAFHMYFASAKECDLIFIPVLQRDGVYCADPFDAKKFIDANQVFGKATQEKMAELNNIAFCLGAKSCAIEIVESDSETEKRSVGIKGNAVKTSSTETQKQSGKRVSFFEGHDDPKIPEMKWFAHDDNIKSLIDMRCKKAIKADVLELRGASSATMSQSIACALDDILKINAKITMEKQAIKEHQSSLIFEIEF